MADTGQGVLLEILQRSAEAAAETASDVRSLRETWTALSGKIDDMSTERAALIREREAAETAAAKAAEKTSKTRDRLLLALAAGGGGVLTTGSGHLLDLVRSLLAVP